MKGVHVLIRWHRGIARHVDLSSNWEEGWPQTRKHQGVRQFMKWVLYTLLVPYSPPITERACTQELYLLILLVAQGIAWRSLLR